MKSKKKLEVSINQIKTACKFYNISYEQLIKNVGLDNYYNLPNNNSVDLIKYELFKISKELNTIPLYFYGVIYDEFLYNGYLTYEKYNQAKKEYKLDEYFSFIGLNEFVKAYTIEGLIREFFPIDGINYTTRAKLNSIITSIYKSPDDIELSALPQSTQIYKHLVKVRPLALKQLPLQTEEICISAVSSFAFAIKYVDEQTERIAYNSVLQNGLALKYVDPSLHTEYVVKMALKQNPLAFCHSHLKTYDICLNAVKANGVNYEFVPEEHRTHELKMEALKSNGWAIKFFDEQTEEYALAAVLQNSETSLYVDEDIRENNQLIKLIHTEILKRHSFLAKSIGAC